MNLGEKVESAAARIYTFGGLRVAGRHGDVTQFRTRQTASLLGYLVAHAGSQVARERLVECFWPDSAPDKARHNLSVALSSLRPSLGAYLYANHTTVRLSAEVSTDLREFESLREHADEDSLRRLIELYRGPFLAGLDDPWIVPLQAAFESRFASACRQLAEMHLAEGDLASARDVLSTWLKLVPDDEDAAGFHLRLAEPQAEPSRAGGECLGREAETNAVANLIRAGGKLITILGPGGVGKTTLGLAVLRELAGERRCIVARLAQLETGCDIMAEIARSIGLTSIEAPARAKQIGRALGDDTLLLLDNLEHLIPLAAQQIDELLDCSDRLQILTTSRRPSKVIGEQCITLEPLPVPDVDQSAECALECPSVRLFIRRAEMADSSFRVTPTSLQSIAKVCGRLEGLPLAIELAASNVAAFSPEYMSDSPQAMGELLGHRAANDLAPHESFSDAVHWSLNLLKPADLALLKRLSFLRGSFDMGLARSMGGTEKSLSELAGNSMLQSTNEGGQRIYRVLEPIREVLDTCTTPEESHEANLLLIEHVRSQTRQIRNDLVGPGQSAALSLADREQSRYERVLATLADLGRADEALVIVSDLRRYWLMSGSHETGLRWTERLLPLSHSQLVKAEALYTAGRLARKIENFSKAVEYFDAGLALGPPPPVEAGCLYGRALMLHIMGRDREALPLAEDALRIFRKLRDSEGILISAKCCGYIHLAMLKGEVGCRFHNEALLAARMAEDAWGELNALEAMAGLQGEQERYMSRRISLCKKNGFKLGLAQALLELGYGRFREGRDEEALVSIREAKDTFRRVGHTIGMIQALNAEAEVHTRLGDRATAISLLQFALVLSRERPESPNGWRTALQLGWMLAPSEPEEAAALAELVLREVPIGPPARLTLSALEAQVLRSYAHGNKPEVDSGLAEMEVVAETLNRAREATRVLELVEALPSIC
ncbi:MAG: AAA family ATPase [Fimbriimonas sp.]